CVARATARGGSGGRGSGAGRQGGGCPAGGPSRRGQRPPPRTETVAMPPDVLMPKLSDTMEEGKILRWLKQRGDRVAIGDVIAEVETDKANMELEAFDEGVLAEIRTPEGESAPVGAVIAVLGDAEAASKDPAGSGAQGADGARSQAAASATKPAPAPTDIRDRRPADGKAAGPAARRPEPSPQREPPDEDEPEPERREPPPDEGEPAP